VKTKPLNVLLLGATGGVGAWIAHYLLKTPTNKVTVVIRNREKLNNIFKSDVDKFENIVQNFNVANEVASYEAEGVPNPFDKFFTDKIDVVINALGTK